MLANHNRPRRRDYLFILLILPVLALACQAVIPVANNAPPVDKPLEATVEVMPAPEIQIEQPAVTGDMSSEEGVLIALYERVNPSVVNITVFSEQNSQVEAASQGSGFVFDSEGHIVTNAHVVHGANQVEVRFSDGSGRVAEIVGEDLNSDLAVVKVESLPDGVGPLKMGDMESLKVGQNVIAIGNPFGLEGTLTQGVISALGRTIPALTPFSIPQSIQTDAAINPGNSGGPLMNMKGEVIGVNAQIETDGVSRSNLGVGFAIPVSIIKHVVPDLVSTGAHVWPWLGVQGGDLSPLLVEAMSLPFDKGAYIASVLSNGPSADAGLRGGGDIRTLRGRQIDVGGDIITAANDQPINSFDDLLVYVALKTRPGDDVTLTVYRDGEYRDISVTLEQRPETFEPQP